MRKDEPVIHAHIHEHADGTVHSHYHMHPGGDIDHVHSADDPSIVDFDPHAETHEHGMIPEHVHEGAAHVEPPLVAEKLTYAYPHADEPVFKNLSMHAHPGQMLAILGNNGAGKSTLLDLLAGMTKPTKGTVRAGGKDIQGMNRREIAQRIAYVAQQQTVPHLTVYDEVLLGRKPHITWSITEADREIVASAIAGLELESFAKRYCDELSGGERQKVFIARAIAQEPQILILDEPTSALDPKNQLEVLSMLRRITRRNILATVLVLHDINLALRFCDSFMLMRDGEIVAAGGHEAVTDEALTRTYDTGFKTVELDGIRVAVPND